MVTKVNETVYLIIKKSDQTDISFCYISQIEGVIFNFLKKFPFFQQIWNFRPKSISGHANHRQILCEWSNDGSKEIELTDKIFIKDEKNYHAWQHRQWAVKRFGLFDEELKFTEKLLLSDIYNNSAWNHRYFIIQNTT